MFVIGVSLYKRTHHFSFLTVAKEVILYVTEIFVEPFSVLFNIGGEAARMTLAAFRSRPDWRKVHNEEIFASLSKTEKHLCKRYVETDLLL